MSEPLMTPPGRAGNRTPPRALKRLLVAALLTAVTAGVVQTIAGNKTRNGFEPRLALPGFQAAIPNITQLEIHSKDERFTVVKDAKGGWGVAERGGFAVRAEPLRELLWGLGELKLVEAKTARPERHALLGLSGPGAGGDAVHITARTGDDTPIASVLFGHPSGGQSLDGALRTYLRLSGEDQAWLGEGRLEVQGALEEWLDLDFLDLDASRIASVKSTPGDVSEGSEGFTIARPGPDIHNFELLELYGKEVMSAPTAANGLGRALIALTFSDVLPVKADQIDFGKAAGAHYETFDGLGLTLRIKRHEENYWITLEAMTFDIEPLENEAERRDVTREALAINARAKGWAFRIPEWKGSQLTVARGSMVKAKNK